MTQDFDASVKCHRALLMLVCCCKLHEQLGKLFPHEEDKPKQPNSWGQLFYIVEQLSQLFMKLAATFQHQSCLQAFYAGVEF
jgi:hypothetical protein